MISKQDIIMAARKLGLKKGDVVLVHSSFKSLGPVQNGAQDVIGGFSEVLGDEGTLVMPTFVQKDFANAYNTWHIDKHSDTGYLTNYLRKLPEASRSDQATHSVAAIGKLAHELTKTHGHTSKRFGNMGDTPFSSDSPWEKMYDLNAKVVLLGVDFMSVTFRHYAEYRYIENCLKSIENHPDYDKLKSELAAHNKPGAWPHVYNMWVYEKLLGKNAVKRCQCGDAELLCFDSKVFVDFVLDALEAGVKDVYWVCPTPGIWDVNEFIEWRNKLLSVQKTNKIN